MHTPKSPQKAHQVEYVRPSLLSPVSFSFVLTRIKSSVFVCVCTVMIICMCRDEARQSFSWIVYMLHVIKDVRVIIDEKPYKIGCRRQLKTIQSSVFILYCVIPLFVLFWIDSLTRSAKPLKLIRGSEIFRLFSILPRNVLRWWMVDCGRHTTLLALMPYFLKEKLEVKISLFER
jgi:hypothetical protein